MGFKVFTSPRRMDWPMAVMLVGSCGLPGCTRDTLDRAAVHGTVLIDGEPLPRGRIVFVPRRENPGPKSGAMILGGEFCIPIEHGPVVGSHRVEIYDEPNTPFEIDNPNAVRQAGGKLLPSPQLPERFHRRSELAATVSDDKVNDLRFELMTEKEVP